MPRIGSLVRRSFGPYEAAVAEFYRRCFVDLDDFAGCLKDWVPAPRRVLEIGCGEGAMVERLARTFAETRITGIDLTARVGRLFRGDAGRVTFRCESVEEAAQREPHAFDLIVLCDVFHHVPPAARRGLLWATRSLLSPDGCLVFKDWLPSPTPIHWLCSGSDRFITGDDVRYATAGEARGLLTEIFGPEAVRDETRVRPWSNNFAFLVRP